MRCNNALPGQATLTTRQECTAFAAALARGSDGLLTVPQKSRRGTPSSMVRRSSRSVMAAQWGTGKIPGGGVKTERSCSQSTQAQQNSSEYRRTAATILPPCTVHPPQLRAERPRAQSWSRNRSLAAPRLGAIRGAVLLCRAHVLGLQRPPACPTRRSQDRRSVKLCTTSPGLRHQFHAPIRAQDSTR